MERKELEEVLKMKIGMELSRFKRKMMRKKPGDIIGEAYHIDCIINIYEMLVEDMSKYPSETVKVLAAFPGLLEYLYHAWLKEEDSYRAELELCRNRSISHLSDTYRECGKEDTTPAA